jgi:DNA-binding IclR family transcriptional regulator
MTVEVLNAHEAIIREFEALREESRKLREEARVLDVSSKKHGGSEIAAGIRKAALEAACAFVRERRAALLPSVRAAALALGEYRSDAATSAASGW